jgi:uncharacterized protein (DUF433 family)
MDNKVKGNGYFMLIKLANRILSAFMPLWPDNMWCSFFSWNSMQYGAISIEAETNNGKPVFNGTDVTVQTLFEYLEDRKSLEKFLNDYPAVNMKDAVEVLQMAKLAITTEKILKENFSVQT